MQPREDSALYLDRTSIRDEHRKRQGSEERISHHILKGIQMKNEHWWRQASEERISHYISIGMEKGADTGEEEARQRGEDSASYLNRFSIRAQEEASSEERISHHV